MCWIPACRSLDPSCMWFVVWVGYRWMCWIIWISWMDADIEETIHGRCVGCPHAGHCGTVVVGAMSHGCSMPSPPHCMVVVGLPCPHIGRPPLGPVVGSHTLIPHNGATVRRAAECSTAWWHSHRTQACHGVMAPVGCGL